jgi:hypothetical protein
MEDKYIHKYVYNEKEGIIEKKEDTYEVVISIGGKEIIVGNINADDNELENMLSRIEAQKKREPNINQPIAKAREYKGHLTVKELRDKIKNLDDDTLVLTQRIEDFYFSTLNWDSFYYQTDKEFLNEQWIPVFKAIHVKDEKVLLITPHY